MTADEGIKKLEQLIGEHKTRQDPQTKEKCFMCGKVDRKDRLHSMVRNFVHEDCLVNQDQEYIEKRIDCENVRKVSYDEWRRLTLGLFTPERQVIEILAGVAMPMGYELIKMKPRRFERLFGKKGVIQP